MKHIVQDIFEGDWDAMIQVCNPFNIWGSGIVIPIKNKYPQAYEADLKTKDMTIEDKIGTYTYGIGDDKKVIANLYAMTHLGVGSNPMDSGIETQPTVPFSEYAFYTALDSFLQNALFGMDDLHKTINRNRYIQTEPIKIGVPYNVGCCRAGGSWSTVKRILTDMENDDQYYGDIEFTIYKLPTR